MQSRQFHDFDEFSSLVGDVDSVMMLQNPRRHLWSITHVYLPQIHVQLGRLGSGNIVEGESWSNGYLLYMPLTDRCAYSANGTVLSEDAFMILEPGCDFCVATKYEHDWCSIFVPCDKFAHGDDLKDASRRTKRNVCRATRGNSELASRFRTLIGQVMAAAATCPQFEASRAASCVEAELLRVASSIVGPELAVGPSYDESSARLPRCEIVRRSRELLQQRAGERVRVEELAAAAGVSERTLRTAFNDYFGVGPVRYLQIQHLHRVRRELKATDPDEATVSEVLVRHGEWEFSRFAARYRKLFGELPSETLRKNR